MKSLSEVIVEAPRRASVVKDIVVLIDREVANKGGMSGFAIKTGYSVVKKLQNGELIPNVVDGLLPEFVKSIEPLHAEFRGAPKGTFAAFLKSNETRAVNAMLSVTDSRAQRTSHAILKNTYQKLRPMAEKQVAEALPGVGEIVDRYCRA
jgi:hypothetical protein